MLCHLHSAYIAVAYFSIRHMIISSKLWLGLKFLSFFRHYEYNYITQICILYLTVRATCLMSFNNANGLSSAGPSGRKSAAACLLRSWVRIPPGAWVFVCCEYCVLSGRGLCDKLITRPEESYRLCCVVVCDLETSRIGAPYIYDISSLRVKGALFL